jgi:hypothetical protein
MLLNGFLMRFIFLLCSFSYAADETVIVPCLDIPEEGDCLEGIDAIDSLQEVNHCLVEEASLEGRSGGQCCYDVIISQCGGGCGGS